MIAGRSLYGQQGVDELDVTAFLKPGRRTHTLGVACFHTSSNSTHPAYPQAPGAGTPRLAVGIRVTTAGGGSVVVAATDATWASFDAQKAYNPSGNAGCIWYRQWQENLDMTRMPAQWWGAGTRTTDAAAAGWGPAELQPAFVGRLVRKSTRAVRIQRVKVALLPRGEPGHFIIDCGREIQGGVTITLAAGVAKQGQVVQVGCVVRSIRHIAPLSDILPHFPYKTAT